MTDRQLRYSMVTTERTLDSVIPISDRFTTDWTAFLATKDKAEEMMGELVLGENEHFRFWICYGTNGERVHVSDTLHKKVKGVGVPENVFEDARRCEDIIRRHTQIVSNDAR